MKHIITLVCLTLFSWNLSAQSLTWLTSKAAAMESARAQGKLVLLLAGRDTCSNCKKMKNTVAETASVKAVINQYYVPWYCNIDKSSEHRAYSAGLGSFSLPLICVINPSNPDVYLDRTTGVQDTPKFLTRLQSFAGTVVTPPPPLITGFTPAQGSPGTTVIINGSGLTGVTQVLFGGVPAIFNAAAGGWQAVVPAGAVSGPITVMMGATSVVSATPFTVTGVVGEAPQITGFDPVQGGPGAIVTILGANLTGVTQVLFGGVPAMFTTTTGLQAAVPAGAATGPITVQTSGGTAVSAAPFTVVVGPTTLPIVGGFVPALGLAGTKVLIYGSHLQNVNSVLFNGVAAAFTTANGLEAVVPATATTGPITVNTTGGTATSASAFGILAPVGGDIVWITSKSNAMAAAKAQGKRVLLLAGRDTCGNCNKTKETIAGTANLKALIQERYVLWYANIDRTTEHKPFTVGLGSYTLPLLCVIDPNQPDVGLDRTTGVQTAAQLIERLQAFVDTWLASRPKVTGFDPVQGLAGSTVNIAGSNLAQATRVLFNGAQAVFSVTAGLQAVVPTEATTGPIIVETPNGATASSTSFVLVLPQPTISGFSPTEGVPGTSVTISGANLVGVTSVKFNGIAATTVVTNAGLQAVVPSGAQSGPITVVTADGEATSAESFRVIIQADLQVSQAAELVEVEGEYQVLFTLTVTNGGPNAATGVVLTNSYATGEEFSLTNWPATDLLTNLTLTATNLSAGAVQVTNGILVWQPGDLPSGSGATLTVVVQDMPSGFLNSLLVAAANEAEVDPVNNADVETLVVPVVVVVPPPVPPLRIALQPNNQVRMTWPAEEGWVLQMTEELRGDQTVWTDVEATPVLDEATGLNGVTVDAQSALGYFRLLHKEITP